MKIVFAILSWIFGFLFFLLFLLSIFSDHYLPSVLALIITVLLVPPARQWISDVIRVPLPLWLRSVAIPVLLFLFIFLIFKDMGNKYSIYKNPEIEKKLQAIYENRMAQWPVPYKSRYIDTQYGKVFVIMSGAEDAPPIFLNHGHARRSKSMFHWYIAGWIYLYEHGSLCT